MLNRFLALVNLNINSSKWYADFKEAKFTDIKKTGRRETVLLTKEPVLSLNCAKVPEGKEITDLKVQYRKEDKPRNCCVEYFHWRIYSNKIVKVQSVIQTLWILCLSQYYSRKQRRVDTNWCTSSLTGWFRNLKQSDCVFFFLVYFDTAPSRIYYHTQVVQKEERAGWWRGWQKVAWSRNYSRSQRIRQEVLE